MFKGFKRNMPKTDPTVFGLISDRGWILERLARAIADEYPDFRYGTVIEGQPDIVYYITYSARKKPYDGLEIGYFSHIEEGLPAEAQFYKIATEVNHCVTQAHRYEDALRIKGARNIVTIPPGIDHDLLRPRLQVGVVGRTYHTGRKGEAMMTRLMDMPEVEFHFTGDGWPGPPCHVPDGQMQNFYRAMDYILVPALYEGGPMCVPEALACGIPVIAPDIGWVEDFPHIPYPKGDDVALRALLLKLAQPKLDLAKSAVNYTWARWGQAHAKLFREVYAAKPRGTTPGAKSPLARAQILQVLHGGERHSQGGPSVRVPQTAKRLAPLCQSSQVSYGAPRDAAPQVDLAHLYNIWQPDTALATARSLKHRARHLVYSPILLDLSLRGFWEGALQEVVQTYPSGPDRFARALPQLQRRYLAALGNRDVALKGYQPLPGFAAKLRACLDLADRAVFLSQSEKQLAEALTGPLPHATILHNPVDTSLYHPDRAAQSPLAAKLHHDLGIAPGTPFLLAVGRIEVRKNQLMMAELARRSGLPLVLVGHIGSRAYADMVVAAGGGYAHLINRVDPHSQDLLWLYQNCAAFLSLSWAEGASLSALEAAASGASMLLTETSSEREYFDTLARFTGPLDVETALTQLQAAIVPRDAKTKQDQHQKIATRFGWQAHLAALGNIYEALL